MALYHLHVRNISRGDGRSAVAAAAYRAGETLPNEVEEKASSFGGRRDVIFAEICTPAGVPAWMRDRATLWNAVERAEKRKDARLAKEIEFALPRELPRAEWLGLARQMADAYTSRGHVVDLAVHDDGTGHNPHVHLMMTTRAIGVDGFGAKLREADGKLFVREARTTWAKIANAALGAAGFALIDPRSHAERGISEQPGQHHAPDRDARRAQREERARMGLHEDVIEARNELLATPEIRARFPVLSARPDWPPEQRHLDGYLPPEARAEHDRFWREVHQRALEPERVRDAEAGRAVFARDADDILAAAEAAEAHEGYLDKIMARSDVRGRFFELRERMVTEFVRAGLVDPRTAEHVRMIEQKLYPDEFSRMRAEAQRIEAKRREPSIEPKPTHAQLRQAAQIERDEENRAFDAYEAARKPSVPTPLLAGEARDAAAISRTTAPDPVPDPDGRPIAPAELERAEARMLQDVEAVIRSEIVAPPPDRQTDQERAAAEAAVAQQNDLDVPEREADSYRPAPHENRLDWLQSLPRSAAEERPAAHVPERADDRLDWLRVLPKPTAEPEQDDDRQPDRYRR